MFVPFPHHLRSVLSVLAIIEKLIRKCNDEQLLILLRKLSSDIVHVSCQKHGSFSVQALIDCIHTDDQVWKNASFVFFPCD